MYWKYQKVARAIRFTPSLLSVKCIEMKKTNPRREYWNDNYSASAGLGEI
jgi:hypothetical protein